LAVQFDFFGDKNKSTILLIAGKFLTFAKFHGNISNFVAKGKFYVSAQNFAARGKPWENCELQLINEFLSANCALT